DSRRPVGPGSGGVRRPSPSTFALSTVVVLGRAMVEDLLTRLKGTGTHAVTVDFALPGFWHALGFEAYPDYGGLAKILA
ncbi:MAG: hypothetical protein GW911_16785, partial [Armatimonadetes bacterium]|nr:hypothetical protein [Armatimonadota bacterium]